MDLKNELIYIRNVKNPWQNFLSYFTEENINNVLRICCTILLLFMLLLFVRLIIKWYFSLRFHIVQNCLCKAVLKNDVLTCMRTLDKYPHLINLCLPDSGYSPFMMACLNGHTQVVKLMIHAGNQAYLSHLKEAKQLCILGADVNQKSLQAESPFYLAVYNHIKNPSLKDASCIHTLYYAGADINAVNRKGYSPLQTASAFGHTGLVKWLLSKGANSNCIPSPYTLARIQGHMETAAALKNKR